jgi:hypothetical protein
MQRVREKLASLLAELRTGRWDDPDSGGSGVREPRRPILPSLHEYEVFEPADDKDDLP